MPKWLDAELRSIGRDPLGGALLMETPYHEWPIGLMFDVYRVLVAVQTPDGVGHVSVEYSVLEEADEARGGLWGATNRPDLAEFVVMVAEAAEDKAEMEDWDSGRLGGGEVIPDTTLTELIEEHGQESFGLPESR